MSNSYSKNNQAKSKRNVKTKTIVYLYAHQKPLPQEDFISLPLSSINISRFISSLNNSQIQMIQTLISKKLHYDILNILPISIITKIISNLNLSCIMNIGGINNKWAVFLCPYLLEESHKLKSMHFVLWVKIMSSQVILWPSVTCKFFLEMPISINTIYKAIKFNFSLRKNWVRCLSRSVSVECHESKVITCLIINPKVSGQIIAASDDNTVSIWKIDSAVDGISQNLSGLELFIRIRPLMILRGHNGGVWALSLNKKAIATGSTDKNVIVWDLTSSKKLLELSGHTSTVRCLIFQDDWIISGSRDGTIRVWNLISGRCIHLLHGHRGSVRCLSAFSTDQFISGSYDHSLMCWNLNIGKCTKIFSGHQGRIYAVASCFVNYGADENGELVEDYLFFSGSIDATVRVWSYNRSTCIKIITGFKSLVGIVEIFKIGVNGPDILIAASTDGSFQIWDVKQLLLLSIVEFAHSNSITCIAINNHVLLTGCEGCVKIWDLRPILALYSKQNMLNSFPIVLKNIGSLVENAGPVWRIVACDRYAVIAYQSLGGTRMKFFDFYQDM